MLEDYQAQSQQAMELVDQAHSILAELGTNLVDSYPKEERTYRMGVAITQVIEASNFLLQASQCMHRIEWPTEDRPR